MSIPFNLNMANSSSAIFSGTNTSGTGEVSQGLSKSKLMIIGFLMLILLLVWRVK